MTEKAENPPRVSCGRGSCANSRPRRKSTAQGRKPSGATKTPPTQQQVSTAGVGQLTGARKVEEPSKGNQRQDTPRKTAGAPGRGTEATPEEAQQYATRGAVGQAPGDRKGRKPPKGKLRQGKLSKLQAPEEEHGTT